MTKKQMFEPGTVVVFDPSSFNQEHWKGLSHDDKVKYYGPLGYGQQKPKFFVFLCEIKNAPGHCVLVSLDNQQIETMRHTNDFREVDDEEF